MKPFACAEKLIVCFVLILYFYEFQRKTHIQHSNFGYKWNFQGETASCPNYHNLLNIEQIHSFLDNMERGVQTGLTALE
jgi:hypothetical protein